MNVKSVRKLMIAAVLGVLPCVCLADTVKIKTLEYKDCRVTGIRGDFIIFEFNGRTQEKLIADVTMIAIDSEPSFTKAEELYGGKQWDKAIDEYERARRGSNQAWIKGWCDIRILDAASKGGRFDLVVKNYIAVAQKNPDTARGIILPPIKADSAYLPEAIKAAEAARNANSANLDVQDVLAKLVVDLYELKGDAKSKDIAEKTRADIVIRLNPNSKEAQDAMIRLLMSKINADLEARKFEEVIKGIDSAADRIHDPAQQVNMLWAMAEARKGKLGAAGGKDDWKEVAIAYMRVVVNGKPADPKVIDSLLKVAEIHATRLDDKPAAQAMLKRMIEEEYKGMEAAKDAQKLMDKLK